MAEKGETRDPSSHRTPGQIKRQVKGYNRTPEQLEKRRQLSRENYRRNKSGEGHVGDGKDVAEKKHHRDGGKATQKNTRLVAQSKNRADNGSRGSVTRRVRGRG
jgi:hypothetical protein